jgi:TPR repeat protein
MFQWFRKAAKKHDGEGLLETGHCYQFGVGDCAVHNRALANSAVNATVLASRRLRGKRRASRAARYRER